MSCIKLLLMTVINYDCESENTKRIEVLVDFKTEENYGYYKDSDNYTNYLLTHSDTKFPSEYFPTRKNYTVTFEFEKNVTEKQLDMYINERELFMTSVIVAKNKYFCW